MNKLKVDKQILVASMLVESSSIRSIERITGVNRNTIMNLGITLGEKARELSDSFMTDIKCDLLQVDEIWCFIGKKNKNLTAQERRQRELGDQYIFVALDSDTKLVPHFEIGKRTMQTTMHFLEELKNRVNSKFQLTTDSFPAYAYAVESVFGRRIDYAQLHKHYADSPEGQRRYSPACIIRVSRKLILGEPDSKHVSTSYVERQNLTMRMNMRRLTRLTNAFSKKLYNLYCAVSLHFFYYNFMRIHQSLRVTPAMESGITKHLWSWDDFFCSLKQVA